MVEKKHKRRRRSMPAALSRLRTIAGIRPEFAGLQSIEEIATTGAWLALKHVDAQAASVYLFDQSGVLGRIALVGRDKNNCELNNNSLPPEYIRPGESFTGRAVFPQAGSPFGAAQWSNALSERKEIMEATRQKYMQVLGDLCAAVSVPLNGSHRTFGALEVINKINEGQDSFDVEDVHWLSLIGNELALVLSEQRRHLRSKILHALAEAVVSMFASTTEEQQVYQDVADSLTDVPLPYRVCVIRLKAANGLATVARASSDVSFAGFDESPLPSSHGLAGYVLQTGGYKFVPNIADLNPAVEGLRNWEWAIENKLVSYAGFPLLVEQEAVGTLSLYFGFPYTIDNDELEFLKTLARFLAAFYNGRRLMQEYQNQTRDDARDATTAEYDTYLAPSRHDVVALLVQLGQALRSLEGKNLATTKAKNEYDELVKSVDDGIEALQEEFSLAQREAIDLNNLIHEVVALKKRLPMKNYVDFKLRLNPRVPDILGRSSALRYVIKDLVANAIKSIQRKDVGFGEIRIETDIVPGAYGVEDIELLVTDTGEGIPREQWDEVFKAGFSTYPDGTGFGLHLARSVVRASYGGEVAIKSSKVGVGSTFRVTIPLLENKA